MIKKLTGIQKSLGSWVIWTLGRREGEEKKTWFGSSITNTKVFAKYDLIWYSKIWSMLWGVRRGRYTVSAVSPKKYLRKTQRKTWLNLKYRISTFSIFFLRNHGVYLFLIHWVIETIPKIPSVNLMLNIFKCSAFKQRNRSSQIYSSLTVTFFFFIFCLLQLFFFEGLIFETLKSSWMKVFSKTML